MPVIDDPLSPLRPTALDLRLESFLETFGEDGGPFDDLARHLLQRQFEGIPLYVDLARHRRQPIDWEGPLEDLPLLPSAFMRKGEIHERPEALCRRFRSSGTSRGVDARLTTAFDSQDLRFMERAIDSNARRMLFPDLDDQAMELLVLAPPPEAAPEMIMVYGMARLGRRFCQGRVRWLLGRDGLDFDGLGKALDEACAARRPVTLAGASFAFVHVLDRAAREGLRWKLPEGSRLLDAGGFKGRSREVDRSDLLQAFAEHLDLPAHHCVNLLGLTEHASQWYDDGLAAWHEGRPCRPGKQVPPWCRSRVVDPATLSPLSAGRAGRLAHLDLANGRHPCLLLTEDLAEGCEDGGFRLLGREASAPVAGCSLSADEWIAEGGRS